MIRKLDFAALPPVYDRGKELIGVIGLMPVLPCYFEVEPHRSCRSLSLAEIRCLLEMGDNEDMPAMSEAAIEDVAQKNETAGAAA